jgi:peptidoglycan/xylan/chitin deacetylase (PgdA/CDA1 family)
VTEGHPARPRFRRGARAGVVVLAVALAGVAAWAPAVGGESENRGSEIRSARSHVADTVRTLPTKEKVVALTFDAGSDQGYAKKILRILKREKVKATFGISGQWVEDNPKITRRIAKRGHTIINHTYSHTSWTGQFSGSGLGSAQRRRELKRTEQLVRKIADVSTKPWFRPPYGDYDRAALRLLPKRGYDYNVMWSTDSGGAAGLSAAAIVQRCLDGARRGAIYLLHVGSQSQDGPALGRLINELKKRDWGFATVRQELPPRR